MLVTKRKALSKRVRFEVFKRDEFSCQYCGATPPKVILHIDHITAVANGGGNDQDNLVTSCEACNLGKGARSLEAVPQSLEERAKRVAESEAQLRGYQEILEEKRERIEDEKWRVADILQPGSPEKGMSRQWLISIKGFIEKLGVHEVMDSAEIARAKFPYANSYTFRYFCGVCWRKIKED